MLLRIIAVEMVSPLNLKLIEMSPQMKPLLFDGIIASSTKMTQTATKRKFHVINFKHIRKINL